jgi:RHS repeat-associated protein
MLVAVSQPIVLLPFVANAACGDPIGVLAYHHYDHLGSTQVKTDENGAVASYVRYTPYGEIRGRFDASGAPIQPGALARHEYTGYETNHISGLQYAGARFYDPELGMFLTHDPEAHFANPYAYALWDPANTTDPDGRFPWGLVLFCIGVALVVANAIYVGVTTGNAGLAFGAFLKGMVMMGMSYGILGPILGASVSGYAAVAQNALRASLAGYAGYSTYKAAKSGDILGAISSGFNAVVGAFGVVRGVANSITSGTTGGDPTPKGTAKNENEFAANANDEVLIDTQTPPPEGWTHQEAAAAVGRSSPGGSVGAGGEVATTGHGLLGEFSHALRRGNMMQIIELIKVGSMPLVVTGSGVSKLLIGGAFVFGLIGVGLPGTLLVAGAMVGVGLFEIGAGVMMANELYGRQYEFGPVSGRAAGKNQ